MKVAIIGAGIAGLTAGLALKKANIPFVIYEGATQIKPVGAGIAIANNAMQVYRHLGIADQLTHKAMRISRVLLTDFKLNKITASDLTPFEKKYQLANIAIHRSELHQVLLEQVGKQNIILNKRLQHITKTPKDTYQITFTDHSVVEHQFIIGADGIHSQTRKQLFTNQPLRDAKQVCWRGTLNYDLPSSYNNTAVEGWGKGKRFGFVSLDKHTVYWYYLVNQGLYDKQAELGLLTQDCPSMVQDIIAQTPEQAIFKDNIYDLKPIKKWYNNKACLIGDAAHATTPNLGQGACQAIEDVYVISKLLETNTLEKALQKYPTLRKKKVNAVVRDSRALGQVAQISNPLLITLRNTVFKILPPYIKNKQMSELFKIN